MKIRFLGAFCTALMLAAPAYAQSSFVLVIGEFSAPRANTVSAADSQAALIETTAERACIEPHLRDLRARSAYRACLDEVRAKALLQLAAR